MRLCGPRTQAPPVRVFLVLWRGQKRQNASPWLTMRTWTACTETSAMHRRARRSRKRERTGARIQYGAYSSGSNLYSDDACAANGRLPSFIEVGGREIKPIVRWLPRTDRACGAEDGCCGTEPVPRSHLNLQRRFEQGAQPCHHPAPPGLHGCALHVSRASHATLLAKADTFPPA